MKGFTLIEVLIAIFLLTTGIVGVMVMFPLAVQTVKSSQMSSQASQLATARMEEMVSKTYTDPALDPTTTTEEYGEIPDFAFHKRTTKVVCADPDDLSDAQCDTDLKKIEVAVFWESRLGIGEQSVKVSSLIAKK